VEKSREDMSAQVGPYVGSRGDKGLFIFDRLTKAVKYKQATNGLALAAGDTSLACLTFPAGFV
jgi:hypothetical protein